MSYYNNWHGSNKGGGKTSSNRSTGSSYGSYYDDDYYGGSSYYGGRYGSSYGSSYGGSYGSSWNWGTFGYSSLVEDVDDDLYIKAHDSYFTPKDSEISKKISRGVDTKQNRKLVKEFSRFFYHKMIGDNNYFDEKYSDESSLSESELEQLSSKKQTYDELWEKFIPGYSPLEQALSLFNELQRKSDGDDLTVERIKEMIDENSFGFNEEIYMDPLINELLDMNDTAKENKIEIMNFISLIKNFGSEFKVEKEIEEKIVANSSVISKKIMRDYSQMAMVDMYQKLMPNYKAKMLCKDLVVNVPVDRTEHKQKIIILLDYSGSMWDDVKQKWVLAIMIDRLRYVLKEEAEIFFSYFVSRTEQLEFHHLHDRKSAIEFWQQFSTQPNGGDTCLGDMINYINDEINTHHRLHNLDIDLSSEKPEVLAINDGQDTIKTNEFVYKTNAISLVDSMNTELKDLCLQNKGKYVFVEGNGKLDIYSNNC